MLSYLFSVIAIEIVLMKIEHNGHDNVVCALEVSGSGALLASGQLGTEKYRGRAAPVFVWDTATGKRLHALRGLTTRVNAIAFSFDERFLCGCGEVGFIVVT